MRTKTAKNVTVEFSNPNIKGVYYPGSTASGCDHVTDITRARRMSNTEAANMVARIAMFSTGGLVGKVVPLA